MTKKLNYKGKSLTIIEWAKKLNIRAQTIEMRLWRGWTIEEALGCDVPYNRNPDGTYKENHGGKGAGLRHGHNKVSKKTTEYSTWAGMLQRCTNQNNIAFENYGGRGIDVCERWKIFENFLSDMGRKPKGFSLERIDNNKGYSPENCKWASKAEQNRNNRRNKMLSYNGETLIMKDWAAKAGISYSCLRKRIKLGWSIEKTLTTPIKL